MKIAINAVNLSSAGGLTVALNFMKCFYEKNLVDTSLIVFAPEKVGYEQYASANIDIITIPPSWNSKIRRLLVDYLWLPKQIKKSKADVIFTMGNFAVPSSVPQGVLFMWPYAIYPEEPRVWDLMGRKDRSIRKLRLNAFKSRLKYANIVFPQTETSQGRLQKYYSSLLQSTHVVPMAYSAIGTDGEMSQEYFHKDPNYKYLLCLTRYYEHKNVEIFLDVAKIIKAKSLSYKIVSTIGADQHPKASKFISDIETQNLSDVLINIGRVPMTDVPHLYKKTDGCILPTLLESFSATYVDSMAFGKPIFTSKRDFAEDACRESAYYFDPFDANEMVKTIHQAFNDESQMTEKIQLGKERIQSLPDWTEVSDMYLDQLSTLAKNQ